MMRVLFAAVLLAAAPLAAKTPAAIFTDPPRDAAHPARMEVMHVPTGDVQINGLAYLASGAGPHPTLVICHGWPGNEKNLDLAQAVRRAGWNAITFNYRGSWGSPGQFHFAQSPEDAAAVLAYLRDPANAAKLGVDPKRIALAGHSMGGWVTALVAAKDRQLIGAATISMGDLGMVGGLTHADLVKLASENAETLATTPEAMADELAANAAAFRTANGAPGLARLPLLVLTSDDGLQPESDALVKAVMAAGGTKVVSAHFKTDHSWSDRRISLQTAIIAWLGTLP